MNVGTVIGIIQIVIGLVIVVGSIGSEEMIKKTKADIVKKVSPTHWTSQAFYLNDQTVKDKDGNTLFYSKKEIDEWLAKLNKALE